MESTFQFNEYTQPSFGGGSGAGAGASKSHPSVPTWARPAADYVFGSQPGNYHNTGWEPGAEAGAKYLNPNDIFPMIQQVLGQAQTGGAAQRDMAGNLMGSAITGTTGIAGQAAAGTSGVNYLNSLVPGLMGAAGDFAGNINQAEGQAFMPAIGAANQTLSNVMSPTYYNPLFRNAAANITPGINADFASKGLGSSGAASAALDTSYSNLADQFAQRQVQEQMAAQQGLGNLGSAFAQTGIAGAQLPGTIFNQLMQGQNTGQQALATAGQTQLDPLAAMAAGQAQYWQGINNPMNTAMGAYTAGTDPLKNMMGGVVGVTGGMSAPATPL